MGFLNKRKVIILGATGSVGTTALKVLDSYKDYFEVVAISAHTNIRKLVDISNQWQCNALCLSGHSSITSFSQFDIDKKNLYVGQDGLAEMIKNVDADIVLNAIGGSAGIMPSFATCQAKKDLALSNKESVVMAGSLLLSEALKYNVKIIPVDSEHSTLYSLLGAFGTEEVNQLVLTASGGPFRSWSKERFKEVTFEMAVAHPTWKMGPKISIDSATLANKGLEVLEAVSFFGFDSSKVEVVIHPQSIVHSLIRMKNGSLYAQLSPPDMSLPIMNALKGDKFKMRDLVRPLDFTDLKLSFSAPDFDKFPLLKLAYSCAAAQKAYPIAYNAANEVAVESFIEGKITFDKIASLVDLSLQKDWHHTFNSLEEVVEIDNLARSYALSLLDRI
jgi:1-deoxy-D-xylulose-5-phosphate reductoisomerase